MFDMYSTCVKYKYRSTSICFHFSMLVLVIIALGLPIFLILNSGGFWMHGWSFMEKPLVNFRYKYLLVADRGIENTPIVCSSLSVYKDNPISDDCILTKIYEVDQNKDDLKDVLHFTTHFRSEKPIKNIQIYLLFGIEFRERKQFSFSTTATLTYTPTQDFQKVLISGDLLLLQKSALREDDFETSNEKISMHEMPHFQFEESSEIFSAKMANEVVSPKSGFAKDEEVVIECKIFYSEQLIHFKLDTWETFKWAWIQYVAIGIVFFYIFKLVTSIILQRRIFRGYLIVPWKKMH